MTIELGDTEVSGSIMRYNSAQGRDRGAERAWNRKNNKLGITINKRQRPETLPAFNKYVQ